MQDVIEVKHFENPWLDITLKHETILATILKDMMDYQTITVAAQWKHLHLPGMHEK